MVALMGDVTRLLQSMKCGMGQAGNEFSSLAVVDSIPRTFCAVNQAENIKTALSSFAIFHNVWEWTEMTLIKAIVNSTAVIKHVLGNLLTRVVLPPPPMGHFLFIGPLWGGP
jgi:hypothetical protein